MQRNNRKEVNGEEVSSTQNKFCLSSSKEMEMERRKSRHSQLYRGLKPHDTIFPKPGCDVESDQPDDGPQYMLSLEAEHGNVVDIKLCFGDGLVPNWVYELMKKKKEGKGDGQPSKNYAESIRKTIALKKNQPVCSVGRSAIIICMEEAFFHTRMPPAVSKGKFSSSIRTSDWRLLHPQVNSTHYTFKDFTINGKTTATLIELNIVETLIPPKGKLCIRLMDCLKGFIEWFEIAYNFEQMPPNSVTHIKQRSFCMPKTFVPELLDPEQFNFDVAFTYLKYSMQVQFYSKLTKQVFLGPKIKIIALPLPGTANLNLAKSYQPDPLFSNRFALF